MTEAIRQGDIPGVQLRCRGSLEVPVDQAWDLLAERPGLESWLCRSAAIDPVEQGAFEWRGDLELGADSTETGVILTAVAPRLLVATLTQPDWPAATRVEFELLPAGDGTSISVLQKGFEHLPLSISLTVWEAYRRRWRGALERLANLG